MSTDSRAVAVAGPTIRDDVSTTEQPHRVGDDADNAVARLNDKEDSDAEQATLFTIINAIY